MWARYFPNAELPLGFYYTHDPGKVPAANQVKPGHCIFSQLEAVRRGQALFFSESTVGCGGGKRYLGFSQELRPNFEYFLSCGIPGKMEGERYKKTPEMVQQLLEKMPSFAAPAPYIVFKRWDQLAETDQPTVVIFFESPDVISGLFTLANFDELDLNAVIAPFGSGCASIVQYPLTEAQSATPRCVLGTFDVSARPHVPGGVLTFAVPWQKMVRMLENVEESFLTIQSWEFIRQRLAKIA